MARECGRPHRGPHDQERVPNTEPTDSLPMLESDRVRARLRLPDAVGADRPRARGRDRPTRHTTHSAVDDAPPGFAARWRFGARAAFVVRFPAAAPQLPVATVSTGSDRRP